MSAELMKSKFVRHPSVVRFAIISEPNARISFKIHMWLLLDYLQRQFLALLDYVSRAHDIAICVSSVRVAIMSEPNAQISFKFWLLLPPGNTLRCFVKF